MNPPAELLPDPDADDDVSLEPRRADALLAATLALMTGFAEHCAAPDEDRSTAPAPSNPAVPRLLAAKAVSNLFFLAQHPALSDPLRGTLWKLRCHWQAIERRATPCGAAKAAAPRPAERAPGGVTMATGEPWVGGEPACVWH